MCLLLAACDGEIIAGASILKPDPGAETRAKADPTLEQLAQKYFPGDDPALPPTRLFRLTRTQLDNTARALLPAHVTASLTATMPQDPLQTNYEYSANLEFNAANFTPYIGWVSQLSASVLASPGDVVGCAAGATACQQAAAKAFVLRAFRGAATDTQLQRYADLFTSSVPTVGVPQATADLVDVTLSAPEYVFRDEVQTDGAGALLPALQLQNLTYTLADVPPEALGMRPDMPADEAALQKVLASPQAHDKLLRFFLSWLEIRQVDDFTLSPVVFPEFTPAMAAAVRAETQRFVEAALNRPQPTLKDVTLAIPADAPDAHRLGVFTTSGMIASHSGPTTTRLVKRGVFFIRKVLCMDLGAPPPDVDRAAANDAGSTQTERQRIESATAPARCQGCHGYINPLGFVQESYDPLGRWRTIDNGAPVDSSVTIPWLDEGTVETDSYVAALKAITASARFKQCFVRQLFRYYLGRDETPGDATLLRDMFFWFAHDDQQDLTRLLLTLAMSSRFAHRVEAP
jgi:hypothetical protein